MRTTQSFRHGLIAAILALLLVNISGCATTNPRDPLEPFNRGVYAFNDGLDTVLLKPVAQGYRAVLPQIVRTGIGNFFSNLDDITVFVNNVLQMKVAQAASDLGRLVVNSTIGLLGLVDVATQLGMEKHNEDFGQTLGYWGIGSGPYLVLPFFGPSSFRDALGRWADSYTDVVWQQDHIRTRNQFYGLRVVDNRSRLLDTEKVLQTAAIDEYSFVRDAYLQRRRNLVYDGNPPPEEDEEPAPKPRSNVEPELKTVLVDQFGRIVAGGEPTTGGIAPQLTEETSKVLPKLAAPNVERRREEASTRPAPAAAAAEEPAKPAPSSSAPAEVPAATAVPVVRVWLSSEAR
jgi:phospholipid-binding lipoprotein MlaA